MPDRPFSLQSNLFFRLVKDKPSERYSATQALRHPWITRQKTDSIPLTVHEEFENIEIECKLRQRMLAVLFLSVCKKQNEAPSPPNSYRRLVSLPAHTLQLDVVSAKITMWHDETQHNSQSRFEHDHEYEEQKHSPDVFRAPRGSRETMTASFDEQLELAEVNERANELDSPLVLHSLDKAHSGQLLARGRTRGSGCRSKFSIMPVQLPGRITRKDSAKGAKGLRDPLLNIVPTKPG